MKTNIVSIVLTLFFAFAAIGQTPDQMLKTTNFVGTDLLMIQTNSAGAAGQKAVRAIRADHFLSGLAALPEFPSGGGGGGSAADTYFTNWTAAISNLVNTKQHGTASLTNWSNLSTSDFANVVSVTGLTNWANAISNLISTRQFGSLNLTNWSALATGVVGTVAAETTLTNWANAISNLVNSKQAGSLNLTNWSALATGVVGTVAAETTLTNWANAISNLVNTRQLGSANLTNWSNLPTGSFANIVGVTGLTNWANAISNLVNTKQQGSETLTNLLYFQGSGSPESVVSSRVGGLFACTNGCTGSGIYVKTNGTGSTGWWLVQGGSGGGGGGSISGELDSLIVTNRLRQLTREIASASDTNAIIDLAKSANVLLVLTTNTHLVFSNLVDGISGQLLVKQDTNGGRLILSCSAVGGLVLTNGPTFAYQTTNANALDIWDFKVHYGTNLMIFQRATYADLVAATNGAFLNTLAAGLGHALVTNGATVSIVQTNRSASIATNATSVTVGFSDAENVQIYNAWFHLTTNLVVSPTNLVTGRTLEIYFATNSLTYDVVITNTAANPVKWNFNVSTNGSTSFTKTNTLAARVFLTAETNGTILAELGYYR